jgi:sortase A
VDQNGYIGYLSLPTFELYLPVMSDWTMDKLRISPCHYYGSVGENNLVIMAHNYRHHFGKLVLLNPGDPIYFTNIFGETFLYKVVKREVLPSKSVPQLTSGEYDLTLFTCTFSGENRTAVRCSYVPLEESDQT